MKEEQQKLDFANFKIQVTPADKESPVKLDTTNNFKKQLSLNISKQNESSDSEFEQENN
jgi:hypothetical protein